MGTPRMQIFADAERVSPAAAQEFVCLAGNAIAAHGRFTVAFSGGSTPRRLLVKFLKEEPGLSLRTGCFGVAGPVINGQCRTTNLP